MIRRFPVKPGQRVRERCCQKVQKVGVVEMELKLDYKGKSLLGTIRKFDGGFKTLIAETIEPLKLFQQAIVFFE